MHHVLAATPIDDGKSASSSALSGAAVGGIAVACVALLIALVYAAIACLSSRRPMDDLVTTPIEQFNNKRPKFAYTDYDKAQKVTGIPHGTSSFPHSAFPEAAAVGDQHLQCGQQGGASRLRGGCL